jgi:hypothetical protein
MDPATAYRISSSQPRSLGEAITGKRTADPSNDFASYIMQLARLTGADPTSLAVMASKNPNKFQELAYRHGLGPPPVAGALPEVKIPEPEPAKAPATTEGTNPLPGSTEIPPRTSHDQTGEEAGKLISPTGPGKDKSEEFDTGEGGSPVKTEKEKIGEAILEGLTGLKPPVQPPNPPAVAPQGPTPVRSIDLLSQTLMPDVARRKSLREAIG